jgi:hypothetical protein
VEKGDRIINRGEEEQNEGGEGEGERAGVITIDS